MLFTSAKRLKFKELRASGPALKDFFEITEDSWLQHIDLSLQSTQNGGAHSLGLRVTANIIDEEDVETRCEQILSNKML